MTDQTVFTPDQELDMGEWGLQPTDATFTIVEADLQETEDGQRYVITFEADEDIENLPNNQVTDRGYLSHATRPELVNIGRGSLKRLTKAALGTERASLQDLIGEKIRGRVYENDAGFTNIGRISAAE